MIELQRMNFQQVEIHHQRRVAHRAQLAVPMAGAFLVWLHFLPHWRETPAPGLKHACFCTDPAIRNLPANLLCEVIGTFVLVLVADAILSKAVAATGPAAGLGPYLVGSLVWGIGLSLGGTTGYAINPARDKAANIMHALLPIPAKDATDWRYAAVPIAGPLIGGALAGVVARAVGF